MEMTDDWVRASLTAGWISCSLDEYQRRDYWVPRARELGRNMSWAFVEQMIAESWAMGVPEQYFTLPSILQDMLKDPGFIAQARDLQLSVDRARNASNN